MLYVTPEPNSKNKYTVAILIKEAALAEKELVNYYLEPLKAQGIPGDNIIFIGLEYNETNKAPVKLIKTHLTTVLTACKSIGVKTLLVADGHYFKTLTKLRRAEPHHGYIKPCAIPQYEYLNVILSVNYQSLFYNPLIKERLDMSLETLTNHSNGTHIDLGTDIIHSAVYPDTTVKINMQLQKLHQHKELVCDVETFGLDIATCGLGTIGFAWDKHNGIAFAVDLFIPTTDNWLILDSLREFFLTYKGKLIYHGGTFDIKVIIYKLFMDHALDTKGLLLGLKTMFKNVDDTLIMTYLATNSSAKNKLNLKQAAFEYTGNYAQEDIKNIKLIPLDILLQYNLIDCLATWYVKEKNYPIMVEDKQLAVYKDIMIPTMQVITHMELNGMPMDKAQITITWDKLTKVEAELNKELYSLRTIKEFEENQQKMACVKANMVLSKLVKDLEEFKDNYNPASPKQTVALLYEHMNLTVMDRTKTKLPSTGADSIQKLLNNLDKNANPEYKRILELLIDIAKVSKIVNTFVKAFKDKTVQKQDNCYYLHGNFNIGGTLSGRLSSSNINLQNLPSTGSKYAKIIKQCFTAPEGWLMVGADFASLEDKISALTTKDPNKVKVYEDGYDGHCLRAYSYFGDQMPDIINDINGINSIETKYTHLRQSSKNATFALTYQGTYVAIMGLGFSQPEAVKIYNNYHNLYKVSDEYIQDKIALASKVGHTTAAFGLRLRTPILGKTIINTRITPYEAQKEGRTMGNFHGQSYGMLNNRASIELHEKLLASAYAENIKPISHIHDAQYFIVKDDLDTLKWLNDNLIKAMEWQDLPELQHDQIKLGGQMSVFYPTWADEIKLPNYCNNQTIYNTVHDAIEERTSDK